MRRNDGWICSAGGVGVGGNGEAARKLKYRRQLQPPRHRGLRVGALTGWRRQGFSEPEKFRNPMEL